MHGQIHLHDADEDSQLPIAMVHYAMVPVAKSGAEGKLTGAARCEA